MTLERLWAGWRPPYLADSGVSEDHSCFLDDAPSHTDGDALILERGSCTYVLMNAYPYAPGHMLVAPYRHVSNLADLTADEYTELWAAVRRAAHALQQAFDPGGINIGANLGRAAGAGVPNHLHVHVVPRWAADTNFMTVIADTRVIPETLYSSWERLRAAWPTDSADSPASS